MPTLLVTGASGYLGQHLIPALKKLAPEDGFEVHLAYGTLATFDEDYRAECFRLHSLDLSDPAAVSSLARATAPDMLLHLAAVSSPVACEHDPDRSLIINCPTSLVDALPAACAVVFLSTDQVYDGTSPPYTEASAASPINLYGRSKLRFESALREARPDRSVCLRSSLIVGGRTPGRCRKQSFLQFCDERFASATPTEFFSDEVRSSLATARSYRPSPFA
jgi:dTDP-4-dehydrorhamnose reductase